MRKFFAILLLTLLPLQVSWAAVAGYCQHEQGTATRHLGHHEHEHHSEATAHDQQAGASATADLDCSVCHGGCLLAMLTEPSLSAATLTVADLTASVDAPASSAPLDRPERPNWS